MPRKKTDLLADIVEDIERTGACPVYNITEEILKQCDALLKKEEESAEKRMGRLPMPACRSVRPLPKARRREISPPWRPAPTAPDERARQSETERHIWQS